MSGATSRKVDRCTPEEEALMDALADVVNARCAGMNFSEVFSCFVSVMRSTAFHTGMPPETLSGLMELAASDNAGWWADYRLQMAKPEGEA